MEPAARTWVVWLVGALVVLFVIDHPSADLVVIVCALTVARRRHSPLGGFLRLGIVFLAVRTVLFAITGHTGDHIIATVPTVTLPALLGGAGLGGRVTAEVVASSISESLRIVAVLAVLGAFLSRTRTIDLVKMLPRFLFEAGLVINISAAFAPQLASSAVRLREAQAMRGERRRIVPVIVPMFATALERSVALAESMDSRGYGRAYHSIGRVGRWAPALALALAATASFWAMNRASTISAIASLAALGGLILSFARMNDAVPRTKYRRRRSGPRDLAIASAAAVSAILAMVVAATGTGAAHYDPYSNLVPAAPSVLATLIALSIGLPTLIAPTRDRR